MKIIVVVAVVFFTVSGAYAQGSGGGACKSDIEKLCSDSEGDPGSVGKCLDENESSLSETCKTEHSRRKQEMGDMDSKMEKVNSVCKADIEQYCAGESTGSESGKTAKSSKNSKRSRNSSTAGNSSSRGGRGVMGCLMKNKENLSEACQTQLAEMKPGRRSSTSSGNAEGGDEMNSGDENGDLQAGSNSGSERRGPPPGGRHGGKGGGRMGPPPDDNMQSPSEE